MITFYRLQSESPNMRKVSLMLEETGLPYTTHTIDPHDQVHMNDDFYSVNPNGTLPAIVDTDTNTAIFESGAILQYLGEKSGKLFPKELGERADVLKWLFFEAANICPALIELHHYIMNDNGEIPESIFTRYQEKLKDYCFILDEQLSKNTFLAGNFSIADIAIYPWSITLEDFADIDISDFPNMNRWIKEIDKRYAV